MQISHFDFRSRQINPLAFETILTHKDSQTRFGCNYRSQAPAPNEVIFDHFTKDKGKFFIDIDSEIVKEAETQKVSEQIIEKENILTT